MDKQIHIYDEINNLINYGIEKKLIDFHDITYIRNKLIGILNLDDFQIETKPNKNTIINLQNLLDNILDWAHMNNVLDDNTISSRDILESLIMDTFIQKPSDIIKNFNDLLEINPEKATKYFYELSENSNYIKTYSISKNKKWQVETEYGNIDITINLSKPEKDPKEIAKSAKAKSFSYPLCLLCRENEGYKGRINHPARTNHRIIPFNLNNENWYFQYSPYVYYNEHCIVLKSTHTPMKIDINTFRRLFDFIDILPHYFIGSNADLPIVGGSILNHDHFQGGNYEFAMAKASISDKFKFTGFPDVQAGILNWPMSVIRLKSKNSKNLVNLAELIFNIWKNYENSDVDIIPYTDKTPHNTITPIARMKNGLYELDLVLRNNRQNSVHPDGIFHPHQNVHHIKKENIGLIEVMGLAVLPARLDNELDKIKHHLLEQSSIEVFCKDKSLIQHKDWYVYLFNKYYKNLDINDFLERETGKKFLQVLIDSGVFKKDLKGQNAFISFMKNLESNLI